jgi:ATP-dependent helicase/nuclease subunit A
VGTLHSFASSLVRSYAVEVGLSPGFEIEDEAASRSRLLQAAGSVLEAHADHDDDALRSLLAAAGGVEALLDAVVSAIVRIGEDGRPASALAVATDDAAQIDDAMQTWLGLCEANRKDKALGKAASAFLAAMQAGNDDARAGAIEALCGVRAQGNKTREAAELFAFRDGLPGKTLAEKGRLFLRKHMVRGLSAPVAALARQLLVETEEASARAAAREGVLGFGDVLRTARDLLRDRPDVAADVGTRIDALLVDEFQDTSRLQRDLVVHLWEREPGARRVGSPATLAHVRRRGLLVVGDRKQSIYGFRGADVAVFAELCVGLAGAKAREALGIEPGVVWEPEVPAADFVALRHNRRGNRELLAFANAYSAVRLRPLADPPELYEIDYVPATEDLRSPPGDARAAGGPRTTWLRLPVVPPAQASHRLDEAVTIATQIAAIVERGEPTVRGRGPRWRDFAVLALRHETLDAVAFVLGQMGVPYAVAGKGFYAAREVRDVIAMLSVLCNPEDRVSLLEVLRGPWVGLRDESLVGLTDPGRGIAALSAWDDGERRALVREEDRPHLERARRVIERLRPRVERLGPAATLREAIRELELFEVLAQLPRAPQRIANVQKLLAIAERERDARGLLVTLERAKEQEESEPEATFFADDDDVVRLMTVHASKGLDFPIVFLPEVGATPRPERSPAIAIDLGVGDEPTQLSARFADAEGFVHDPPSFLRTRARGARRDAAERARLAYVAATRASDAIVFVGDRRLPNAGVTEAFRLTTAGALLQLTETEATAKAAELVARDAEAHPKLTPLPAPAHTRNVEPAAAPPRATPQWRTVTIATTALQDFEHCPRRFQLKAVVGLPERFNPARARDEGAATSAGAARAAGTLAHKVLETIGVKHFGLERKSGAPDTDAAIEEILDQLGVGALEAARAEVAERAARFLRSEYATRVRDEGAEVVRERPFVLSLEAADKTVLLRGTIDVLVRWPDGSVDVVDYKRAAVPSAEPYAFQLDAYVLAAHALEPHARVVRAGLVFLGGAAAEPIWKASSEVAVVRGRIAALAAALVEARWANVFPRVEPARCDKVRCGYAGLCYPAREGPRQLSLFGG